MIDYFFQEAAAYADENGLLFMETSAKTAMHVNDIFLAIGKYIIFYSSLHQNTLIFEYHLRRNV